MDDWATITRCSSGADKESLYQLLKNAIDNKIENIDGKSILLKPNYGDRQHYSTGAVTHLFLLEALVRFYLEKGAEKICIAESSGAMFSSSEQAFKMNGLLELPNIYSDSLEIRDIKECGFITKYLDNEEGVFSSISITSLIEEYDYLVNIPVMKTHALTGVTLGYKNLKGLISDIEKKRFHMDGLIKGIIALNRLVVPDLIVLDGIVGMQGNGPIYGDPANMNLFVCTNSPAVAEILGTRLMGYKPDEFEYLIEARNQGIIPDKIWTLENVDLLGVPWKKAIKNFVRPHTPDLKRFNIKCLSDGACSGCLNLLYLLFSDPIIARLNKESTVVAGTTKLQDEYTKKFNNLILLGECQNKNKGMGMFFKGCPPCSVSVQERLLDPLRRLKLGEK